MPFFFFVFVHCNQSQPLLHGCSLLIAGPLSFLTWRSGGHAVKQLEKKWKLSKVAGVIGTLSRFYCIKESKYKRQQKPIEDFLS